MFLQGVVVSGGEATLQEGLPAFLQELREVIPCVKLDTNGARPSVVRKVIQEKLVDFIAMDIKGPLRRYAEFAGTAVDTGKVRESIELILGSGLDHEFRTTVVPGLHRREDLVEVLRMVPGARRFAFQDFSDGDVIRPGTGKGKQLSRETVEDLLLKEGREMGQVCCRW